MRWWKLGLGGLLLVWVLGTAYLQARRRRQRVGLALLFLGAGVLSFAIAALSPEPPMTPSLASLLVVASIVLLALAIGVVLWRGFGR